MSCERCGKDSGKHYCYAGFPPDRYSPGDLAQTYNEGVERERLAIKTWVGKRIADYRSLPTLGATSQRMFLEFQGYVKALEDVKKMLFERD